MSFVLSGCSDGGMYIDGPWKEARDEVMMHCERHPFGALLYAKTAGEDVYNHRQPPAEAQTTLSTHPRNQRVELRQGPRPTP